MKLTFGWEAAVAVMVLGLWAECSAARAGEEKTVPPERQLTVSAAFVGGEDERDEKLSAYFADSLPQGRSFAVTTARHCRWQDLPRGCLAATHVNTLALRFGHREEQLAFMLDDDRRTVTLAVRATALHGQEGTYYHSFSAPPGDYQHPANVRSDLVNNFGFYFVRRPVPEGTAQLILIDMDTEPPAELGGDQAEVSSDGAFALMQMRPMMAAAMYAEGWRASLAPQPDAVVLSVRQEPLFFTLRATSYRGGKRQHTALHRQIRHERLYDALRLVFLHAMLWRGGVADCVNLGVDKPRPVWAGGIERADDGALGFRLSSVVVVAHDQSHAAVEIATGEQLWTTARERKSAVLCARGGGIYELEGTDLKRICPTNGAVRFTIPDAGPLFGAADGRLALASGGRLRMFEYGVEVASSALDAPAVAAPAILPDGRVVVGVRGGLRTFDWRGQPLWQTPLPQDVADPIAEAGGLILAATSSGILFAVDGNGGLRWQTDLGDVMAGTPAVVGNLIFAASKARRLFLLDPVDGKVVKLHETSGWLTAAAAFGGKIYALDAGRNLAVLDAGSLVPERVLRFPFALQPAALEASGIRMESTGLDLGGSAAAQLLWTDAKGNCLIIPLP